jgi:formylglycine-generating enzyme required for sulfatase activity
VISDPSGATIHLNDNPYGKTPRTVTGVVGARVRMRLTLEGHEPFEKDVDLQPGETVKEVVTLERRPAPPQPRVVEPPPPSAQPRAGERREWTIRGERFAFRWIPPGETRIGSPEDEPGRSDNEERYTVQFERGFWMQETEVTQRQWEKVMGPPNPSHFRACEECPVEQVSWGQAREFCEELDRQTKVYRLPNEAEWEYAARAESERPFGRPCTDYGESTMYGAARCLDRIGWYWGNSANRTHTPCERPVEPNGWGLCDMHGNVWEWVEDTYVAKARYSTDLVVDPRPVEGGRNHVLRGGSWYDYPAILRAAFRYRIEPDDRYLIVGFRCARDAE